MIALLGASAITLTMLQATINAPTEAFRGCLKQAVAKAKSDKVGGDAIEAYLRNACTVQMGSLKDAVVTFRMKNGMTRKAATSDAEMTVDDYVSTPADNYKYLADLDSKSKTSPAPAAAQPVAATPAITPASSPQPPKP